jgi:hypothetical protein
VCAVSNCCGRFRVPEAQILIIPVGGCKGVLNGASWGSTPAFTRVYVRQSADEADLKNDWVMTHEMVHYAFASMAEEHHWIEERIATYVEPIARLETGNISARKVWDDLVDGLPYGVPRPGDQGLDYTHTPGDPRTGLTPCSVCSPTFGYAARPKIVMGSAMRCAPSSIMVETLKRAGL